LTCSGRALALGLNRVLSRPLVERAAVMLLALLLGRWRRLGEHGIQVPAMVLLALITAGGTSAGFTYMTLLEPRSWIRRNGLCRRRADEASGRCRIMCQPVRGSGLRARNSRPSRVCSVDTYTAIDKEIAEDLDAIEREVFSGQVRDG